MTNEEFDRKAEFLRNQQARFDADMRRLEVAQEKTQKAVAQAAETVSSLASLTFEGFKITDDKIRQLVESQKITEQELQNLITKVDHHISGDHPSAGS